VKRWVPLAKKSASAFLLLATHWLTSSQWHPTNQQRQNTRWYLPTGNGDCQERQVALLRMAAKPGATASRTVRGDTHAERRREGRRDTSAGKNARPGLKKDSRSPFRASDNGSEPSQREGPPCPLHGGGRPAFFMWWNHLLVTARRCRRSCPPRFGGFMRGGQDCPPRKVDFGGFGTPDRLWSR